MKEQKEKTIDEIRAMLLDDHNNPKTINMKIRAKDYAPKYHGVDICMGDENIVMLDDVIFGGLTKLQVELTGQTDLFHVTMSFLTNKVKISDASTSPKEGASE